MSDKVTVPNPQSIVCLHNNPTYEIHTVGPAKLDFITFHVDSIPFRTKVKLEHGICAHGCCATMSDSVYVQLVKAMGEANKQLNEDVMKYNTFDAAPIDIFCPDCGHLNSSHNNPNTVSCSKCGASLPNMFDGHATEYKATATAKRWFTVSVEYGFYDKENEFRRGATMQLLYCTPETVTTTAMAQFQRPDGFKSINGLKVWGPDHTLDSFSPPCYAPLA